MTTCPRCGSQLAPIAHSPATAPWLCRECSRGWYAAELTADARAVYRRETDDFNPHLEVKRAIAAERELAAQRGTSLRHDQVAHVPVEALHGLPPTIATDLAAMVEARLEGAS